jgi:radical SAM superfamily enzyme YgiQ (UPF0313 family)
MRILLISPNIKGMKDGVNRIQPPLGLSYISSYLKSNHDVFIRDTAIEGWEYQREINEKMILIGESSSDISSYIQKINPDLVGISVLFSNLLDSANEIANLSKTINPNIIVAMGGNHITNIIRDIQYGIPVEMNPNVDYYFQGESELSFKSFLDNFSSINPNTKIQSNTQFLDISDLPLPSWEYFNMEKYFSVGLFHSAQSYSNRVLPVMASRGCPEQCQFCTTPFTWGSKVRWRSSKNIYEEIKTFKEIYKIEEIQFQDDTLTANQKNLYELCEYIKEFNLPWCTPNGIKINYHLNNQPEMFKKMKESGCYQVTFACESGSQRVLDEIIKKNTKISQFKLAIKQAKESGLFVHTFWIVGFPGETYDEMNKTIEIAESCEADSFSLSILSPLPGTPLYYQALKNNLWWDSSFNIGNTLFRNSLLKVDGFKSPEEFELWVDENNIYLNSILEKKDPIRYKLVTENRGVMLKSHLLRKIKQT